MLKLKNKKVFVTGATGQIGRYLVERLAKEGCRICVLVRKKTNVFDKLKNVDLILGDIRNSRSFELKHCDYVFHLAAYQNINDQCYASFRMTNVLGTEILLKKTLKIKLKRFIYVSTAMVFKPTGKIPRDEGWEKRRDDKNFYVKSKLEACKIVNNYKKKLPIITVYPTIVLDRNEVQHSKFTGNWWQSLIWKFLGQGIPGGVMGLIGPKDRMINFIWVEDLVDKMIKVAVKGVNGDDYILCGKNIPVGEYLKTMSLIKGVKPVSLRIPKLIGELFLGDLPTDMCFKSNKY